MKKADLIRLLAATAEVCGTQFSEAAATIFVRDLEGFDPEHVAGALKRCRLEVKGRLTVSDVINRMDDGRPGPEEAWSMLPVDEYSTVVWCEEMREAWAVCRGIMQMGERIPARMAFKEAYVGLTARARDRREPVRWTLSLGRDVEARVAPLVDAVKKGRLPADYVQKLLPHIDISTGRQIEAVKLRELTAAAGTLNLSINREFGSTPESDLVAVPAAADKL